MQMATLFALVEKDDQNNTQSMTYCFQRDLVTQILGQPVMLARYEFAGKFMAYCLYRGMYVSAQLTPFVYKYLLNPDVAVTYEDYLKVGCCFSACTVLLDQNYLHCFELCRVHPLCVLWVDSLLLWDRSCFIQCILCVCLTSMHPLCVAAKWNLLLTRTDQIAPTTASNKQAELSAEDLTDDYIEDCLCLVWQVCACVTVSCVCELFLYFTDSSGTRLLGHG